MTTAGPPKMPSSPKAKGKLGGGGGVNPLKSPRVTPPVSPLHDSEPTEGLAPLYPTTPPAQQLDVMSIPIPTEDVSATGPMSPEDERHLQACEASMEDLRLAFAKAGRALEIIRGRRLYRGEYTSFDEYVERRWGMQRSYASKLIRAWPLAEQLRPHAPALNEGQVRELLPVAASYGHDAAVLVYKTVATTEGVKVTAGTLRSVVQVLPQGDYDEDIFEDRIRAWLRGELPDPVGRPQPVGVFGAVESRIDALTDKLVRGKASEDPQAAKAFAAKLRNVAQLIEELSEEAS